MRATVTTTIPTNIAQDIAEYAIEKFNKYLVDPNFGRCTCPTNRCNPITAPCTCGADYEEIILTPDGYRVRWDHYGAEIGIEYPDTDTISIIGITCSGTVEQVRINVHTGKIRYHFDGRRQSGGGSIWDLLHPTAWEQINDANNWLLIHLDTSRPDWSVKLPLLRGRFGTGPCNLREQDKQDCRLYLKQQLRRLKAAGYPIPEGGLHCAMEGGHPTLLKQDGTPFLPDFQGVHYRRAAANGVRL